MPKFNKSTGYKMKGFSGFYDSPLKDVAQSPLLPSEYTPETPTYTPPPTTNTSYLSTEIASDNITNEKADPRPDYKRLIGEGGKTSKSKYMGYRKFKSKTKGVGDYGEEGATREQYKDWKQEHGFKSGLAENLKKVNPKIWESMISGAVGPMVQALFREKEKAPSPKFGSAAEGFSQIQIGTGQKI